MRNRKLLCASINPHDTTLQSVALSGRLMGTCGKE